jgi:D-glycero-D-manno-heptose 1,7-bisphosphate phosphatase
MKRPAVFFDRDNTLIVGSEYLGDPTQVKLMDGAVDAVARARKLGFATVVVSNQSGVARGMFDEDAVRAVNARLDEILHQANSSAVIDRHEFCPYHPDGTVEEYRGESERRKPKPGMILEAARALALDLSRSWVIGDAPRDIEAGHAAGCGTILLKMPHLRQSPAAAEASNVEPDFVAGSLGEAMDLIERATSGSAPVPMPDPTPSSSGVLSGSRSSGELQKLVKIGEQLLAELKRREEQSKAEFSISKLLAGVTQIIALAVLFVAYLNRSQQQFLTMIAVAIFLQLFTIALLLMGRDHDR